MKWLKANRRWLVIVGANMAKNFVVPIDGEQRKAECLPGTDLAHGFADHA